METPWLHRFTRHFATAAIAMAVVTSCKDRGPAQSAPRDSGASGARGDERDGFLFGGTGGRAGNGDAGARECHAERFALEGDGSAGCVLRFNEAIASVNHVQVRVSTGRFLQRGSLDACSADGWYWSEAPPDGAVLSLCDEACAALRAEGVDFVDAMIGCGSPTFR